MSCRLPIAFSLLLLAALPLPAAPPLPAERLVGELLDDWHDAAAKADEPRYFSHFAPEGVFLGTDPDERWNVAGFRAYAHPFFAKGKAWTFVPFDRHVVVDAGGQVAWFDERLRSESYGEPAEAASPGGTRRGAGRSRSTT